MNNYFYFLIDSLKDHFDNDPFVKTVTEGDIDEIDLGKMNLFPYAHITVNNVTPTSSTVEFNFSVLVMDVVDISKDEVTDKVERNDNRLDVLNNTLAILLRLHKSLNNGDLYDLNIELESVEAFEPFDERFENNLAGWAGSFNVSLPNNMTIC